MTHVPLPAHGLVFGSTSAICNTLIVVDYFILIIMITTTDYADSKNMALKKKRKKKSLISLAYFSWQRLAL